MSQAFCPQCGTRRDDDSTPNCTNCGALFASGQSTPIVPSDEAPTRIGNRPPSSPQGGANAGPQSTPPGAQQGAAQGEHSGQQPWTPAAVQGTGNQGTGNQGTGNQGTGNQGNDQTAQFPQQPYGGAQPGAVAGQGWQQAPPAYAQQGPGGPQGPAGPQGPGGPQWGAPGQQPSKGGNAKLWILLGIAVLIIGGGIATALVLTLGGDDDDDKDSMSDEEQIEQVVTGYNDAYQKLLDGDASACDDLVELVSEDELEDDDLESCRDEAGGASESGVSYEVKFKSAEVDGDTATATVDIVSSFGESEPSTTEEELPLVKEDGDWKLTFEETATEEPSVETPSYGSEDPSYGSDDPSYGSDDPTYGSDDPSMSPSY